MLCVRSGDWQFSNHQYQFRAMTQFILTHPMCKKSEFIFPHCVYLHPFLGSYGFKDWLLNGGKVSGKPTTV